MGPVWLAAIQAEALAILGEVDIPALIGRINRLGLVRGETIIDPTLHRAMGELCREGGWALPQEFKVGPMNSPGSLLHWRAGPDYGTPW